MSELIIRIKKYIFWMFKILSVTKNNWQCIVETQNYRIYILIYDAKGFNFCLSLSSSMNISIHICEDFLHTEPNYYLQVCLYHYDFLVFTNMFLIKRNLEWIWFICLFSLAKIIGQ